MPALAQIRPRRLLALAAGWAAGLATVAVAGLAIVEAGLFDVSAVHPHLAPIAWATHTTMIHAVRREATGAPPPQADSAMLARGASLYAGRCQACHGGPGVSRARWVEGLTPTPPYLIDAGERWTAPQLHLIIAGGVKMTAMPGWSRTLTSRQIDDVAAFVAAMGRVTPANYARLTEPGTSRTSAAAPPER